MIKDPVFLLGFHRGGTTLVQRLLNCHEDLVVWGEHAGLIDIYRQAYEGFRVAPIQTIDAGDYADFRKFAEKFVPWANPISADGLLAAMAKHIDDVFGINSPSVRWG